MSLFSFVLFLFFFYLYFIATKQALQQNYYYKQIYNSSINIVPIEDIFKYSKNKFHLSFYDINKIWFITNKYKVRQTNPTHKHKCPELFIFAVLLYKIKLFLLGFVKAKYDFGSLE